MQLKERESEQADLVASSSDEGRFIDNQTVGEFKKYIEIPLQCFSLVEQFTKDADGWRGQMGLTLGQRLAKRGLSPQWAGAEAGIGHTDVLQAKRMFIDSEARLVSASRAYNRRLRPRQQTVESGSPAGE
jgi:hypothetical protein